MGIFAHNWAPETHGLETYTIEMRKNNRNHDSAIHFDKQVSLRQPLTENYPPAGYAFFLLSVLMEKSTEIEKEQFWRDLEKDNIIWLSRLRSQGGLLACAGNMVQ